MFEKCDLGGLVRDCGWCSVWGFWGVVLFWVVGVFLEWGGECFVVRVFFSYREILDRK